MKKIIESKLRITQDVRELETTLFKGVQRKVIKPPQIVVQALQHCEMAKTDGDIALLNRHVLRAYRDAVSDISNSSGKRKITVCAVETSKLQIVLHHAIYPLPHIPKLFVELCSIRMVAANGKVIGSDEIWEILVDSDYILTEAKKWEAKVGAIIKSNCENEGSILTTMTDIMFEFSPHALKKINTALSG